MATQHEVVFSGMAQRSIDFWLTVLKSKGKEEFMCYLKLTPPYKRLRGMLLRDNEGEIIFAETEDEAFSVGRRFMLSELVGEE